MPRDNNFDANYLKDLKNAQIIARGKRVGIWEGVESDSQESEDENAG